MKSLSDIPVSSLILTISIIAAGGVISGAVISVSDDTFPAESVAVTTSSSPLFTAGLNVTL